ncbi:NAD(+) diphosphatase [Treponema pectinovorum]|uniref:NAD(+) diphosphatase n=1 Tax=Treponema pectinovorum TaxID=164 RepID=UPI0021C322DB|nr:NAD(+) diphosphatase [Treponema pectinovorum]
MALISKKLERFMKDKFLFCGNNIILQDGNLPEEKTLKRCFDLNVASDWFNDEEYDFSAVELEKNCPTPAGCEEIPLRQYFWDAKNEPFSVKKAARAKGLLNFRRDNRYCSFCGGALKDDECFVAKVCVQCGRQYFPQIEPAVIILVKKDDKILLAKHKNRATNFYTCIAGFVEIGETIEQTVAREVKEETSLNVKNIRYVASQAWPYPDQLMLAFTCEWESGEIKIQEDELTDANWFSLQDLPPTPPEGSVAYNLIHSIF